MTEKKIYGLRLACSNCGYKWYKDIPFGRDFHSSVFGYPAIIDSMGIVKCPSCGSGSVFNITKEGEMYTWKSKKSR